MIRDGAVRPGQRMREIQIAEAQGVSRTPVREAMHRLVSEGLLEATAARGIAVTELSKQQVLELYALHELLGHIHRISDEEHAQLNKNFHTQIAEATQHLS